MPLAICQATDIANKLMFVAFNPCSHSPQWIQREREREREILEMNWTYNEIQPWGHGYRERRTCFTFAFPWSTPDERQAVREMPQASRHQWRNGSKSLKHILCVWFHLIPLWCRSGPGSHVNTSWMMILECYRLGWLNTHASLHRCEQRRKWLEIFEGEEICGGMVSPGLALRRVSSVWWKLKDLLNWRLSDMPKVDLIMRPGLSLHTQILMGENNKHLG